jgi:CRP-like cAMP-binding protein
MGAEPSAALDRRGASALLGAASGVPLTADEAIVLQSLHSTSRIVRRGHEIISEGRRTKTLYVLLEGTAIRYRFLRDGQRQILNLLLPGDFVGIRSCFFESALYSVKTLTRAVISPMPLARLVGLVETHPRLAAKLFWSFSYEATILSEHLIAVGRRPALERVAHLLLELLTRLQRIGLAGERSFRLPLTQEMISDALGLSAPYVNRVLHQLRDDGYIQFKDQNIVIENVEELSAMADFEHTYLKPLSMADLLAEHA